MREVGLTVVDKAHFNACRMPSSIVINLSCMVWF